jgi:hypothetical protein
VNGVDDDALRLQQEPQGVHQVRLVVGHENARGLDGREHGGDVTNSCAIAGLAFALEEMTLGSGVVFAAGHLRPPAGRWKAYDLGREVEVSLTVC